MKLACESQSGHCVHTNNTAPCSDGNACTTGDVCAGGSCQAGAGTLVCNDGKVSALVARTLGFCKINTASYLEGGLAAWAAAGGKLVETTRSGFEHELPPPPPPGPPPDPAPTRWLRSIKNTLFGGDKDPAS